uniref:Zinc-finger domain-containing protein n=1 Tax=Ignavibacterium album TaxID=591197 RepID=A0A832DKU2_9BACT
MKAKTEMLETILRYFDGEMSSEEKEKFISELKSNPELKKQFDELRKVYEITSEMKNQKVEENYLETITPKFRERLSLNKNKFKLKPAFVFGILIVLIAISTLLFIPEKQSVTISNLSQLTDEELLQKLSTDYLEMIEQDKIDSLLVEEIKTNSNKIASYIFNGDDINNLYRKNLITPEDENEIYLALIETKF